MSEDKLYKLRHTLAHILAKAVLEHDPNAKLAIGPPIENGFYYDFELSKEIGDKDLKKLEKRMRQIIKEGFKPERRVLNAKEAQDKLQGQNYKLELLQEFESTGEEISFYKIADFEDLCEGPHVEDSKDIDPEAFKLDKVAGAYWRGDEKNKMLTRIYGLAFETKEDLENYLQMREEAKKRDHRKLGKELDLFTFSELVGAGLPLWTPNGTVLRNLLNDFVQELRKKHNYEFVTIPHITKKDLYETSGHWQKFAEELFKVQSREGKEYALKPMNCPHHTQIFARKPVSYREMPKRYAETTMVYRDEQSGELGGLTRVLSITQDDSHIFCRRAQIKDEFFKIWDIIDNFYGAFGFKLRVRLSFHDPENKEAYLGDESVWQEAESALKEIAQERNADYFIGEGEAAMYGPKLDFMATDAIGREHQIATIQLDFNLPERFNLTCVNENGEKERIVMIHSAIMGSIERFSAVLIEHLEGKFPLWLAPVQMAILPIAEAHLDYSKELKEKLEKEGFRVELNEPDESLGKRIRNAKKEKLPYILVLGDKEKESGAVTAERRDGEKLELPFDEFLAIVKDELAKKILW